MPYRFKTNEPIEKGFRRIAREQLDSSLAELSGPVIGAKNVHECRKSLKRLRALVRLAADALGGGKARNRTKSLGEIAKLLSARRDQTVMLDTIEKLSQDSQNTAAIFAPLKAALTPKETAQTETLDSDIAVQARQRLLAELKKFAHAKFAKRGFAALAGGLGESYRQGRVAAKFAYEEPTDENFHDLRKAVQWHWRQMSLLSRAWPDEFAVRVHAARELSQQLGEDHDLAMLVAAAGSAKELSDDHKDAVIGICRQHQEILRAAARNPAKRLFAEKPDAFVARMAAYWRHSRSLEPRLEVQPAVRQLEAAEKVSPAAAEVSIPDTEKRQTPAKPRLATKSEPGAPSQRRA